MRLPILTAALVLLVTFLTLCPTYFSFLASRLHNDFIFIVSSYSKEDLCGKPQLEGILQALNEGHHKYLHIKKFYLYTKKSSETEVKKRAAIALDRIKKEHPRIVITVDDAALLRVGLALNHINDTFVVFSGINGDISTYNKRSPFMKDGKPTSNITGVLEHLFLNQQVDFLKLIGKWPCSLGILYSTDFMGEKGRRQITSRLMAGGAGKNIRYFAVSDMTELDQKARLINEDNKICAYFPLVLSIIDKSKGKRLSMDVIVPEITSRIHKIDIAVNKSFTRAGFFGGANVDLFHMGYQAGQMANMLLDGVDIQRLPIEEAERFQVIVNKKRARELGLDLTPDVLCLVDELI